MVQIRKVLGSLGLAMKAGDVVSGEFMTEKAIREGIAKLVIVAEDASGNTKKWICKSNWQEFRFGGNKVWQK